MANREETLQSGSGPGFSCPSCHTLFRAPEEAAGKQVECPTCGAVVSLPGGDDGNGGENRFRKIEDRRAARGRKRVRRKTKKRKLTTDHDDEFDWERDGVSSVPLRTPGSRMLIAGGAALFIAMGGVVALILTSGEGVSKDQEGISKKAPQSGPVGKPEDSATELVPPSIAKVEMATTMAAIEAVVRDFLGARAVEDLIKHVRGGEAVRARIRDYYQSREYAETPYRDVAPNGRIMKSGELWAVDVVLKDFTIRPIALEKIGEGYLVDWESWVGYSEIPWEEFVRTRPTEPKLFRVLCSEASYFNFDFVDEQKWTSFRLESPDHQHLVYGYVPRFSIQESMLSPVDRRRVRPAAFLVTLRFPDRSRTADQVLIEEVVASGWVSTEAALPSAGTDPE